MNIKSMVLGSLMLGLSGWAFGDQTSLTKMTGIAGQLGVKINPEDIPPPQSVKSAPVLESSGRREVAREGHPKKRVFPGSCDMDTTVHFFSGFPVDDTIRALNGVGLALLQNAGKYSPGATSPQGVSCAKAQAMEACLALHAVCVPAEGSPYVFSVRDPEARGHVTRHIVILIGMSQDEQGHGLERAIQDFLKSKDRR